MRHDVLEYFSVYGTALSMWVSLMGEWPRLVTRLPRHLPARSQKQQSPLALLSTPHRSVCSPLLGFEAWFN